MNLLSDLSVILAPIGIPIETGVFSGVPPDEYIVITPLADIYDLYADNRPGTDVQYVRLSLYTKGNYLQQKRRVENALLEAGLTITERRYIGHEDDTGFHSYSVDCGKDYKLDF